MNCSDFQRVLPEFVDGAPDGASQTEFETHLESCADCSGLMSELELIASEARQLEASEEPAPRVWVRIAAELRAEGLIREPELVSSRPVLVPTSPRRRWSALWLAPVAAALLAVGSYFISHKPAPIVAKQDALTTPVITPTTIAPQVAQASPDTAPTAVPRPAPVQMAKKSVKPENTMGAAVEPASSADDQQFLSVVSTRAPSMRATYESQLQAVNAEIRETQAYVDRNPGDADARQHLMDAYEQKALLYQIALDRIQ
jgi:Putative zinc-finger